MNYEVICHSFSKSIVNWFLTPTLASIVEENIIVDNPDGESILHKIIQNAYCECIYLCNIDIETNDVPKKIVTNRVKIEKLTGNLLNLFQNLECKRLSLANIVIDKNVTQYLQLLLSNFIEVLEVGTEVKQELLFSW